MRSRAAAVGIVGAALALRLAGLRSIPPGLFVDEAYTGYDAWSVLRTGRDLWGERLPLYFASWGGDSVEGLYRYLCLPFVALLGPDELAVRLPAALAGAAAVGLTFLLGRRLLGGAGGLIAAGLLALSPWHLPFSRVGFRGILVPAAALAVAWLGAVAAGLGRDEDSRRPRPRLWLAAAAAVPLLLYSYSVAKLFTPLFLLLLLLAFRGQLRGRARQAAAVLALVGLLALPAAWETFAGQGQVRFRNISAVSPAGLERAAEGLRREHPGLARLTDSRPLVAAWTLAANYLSHFGPGFLLTGGDRNLRHSPPGVGQLLWVEALLLAAGLVRAMRRRSRVDLLLVGWLMLGPVPDSLTSDRVPNALRALCTLPAPQLLAASGALALSAWLRRPAPGAAWLRPAVGTALALGLGLQAASYLQGYFTTYPVVSAPYWNAGYPEGVRRLEALAPPGARLVVARPEDARVSRYALNPYLHSVILFYRAHPPAAFQAGGGMGRFEVSRIPETGPVPAATVPAGTWLLLPADRAVPAEVRDWIPGPGGRPALAILEGRGRA